MMNDPDADSEMRSLANEEYYALKNELPELEQKIKVLLLPKDEADERNVILEVRAGTGGEEAALFAAELFRMYERYSAIKGWKFETLEKLKEELEKEPDMILNQYEIDSLSKETKSDLLMVLYKMEDE